MDASLQRYIGASVEDAREGIEVALKAAEDSLEMFSRVSWTLSRTSEMICEISGRSRERVHDAP